MNARPPTKAVDLKLAPISLASICFSFGGNLNWLDLEASIGFPKQWAKTLSLATSFIALIYLCVAVVSYAVYGDLTKSPIMLSLAPTKQWLCRIGFCSLLMLVLVFCALFVSDISKVVPILGAVAASMVGFITPVACHVRLYKGNRVFLVWEYIWCGFITGIGTSQAFFDL
ncbi:hypothetical protein LPJ66_002376 [Kickxella alabastrina]|uniref:Uncharacterized protein n=1 Tax=Kickxella alabastrina TaxID=61397 RepID=A0ACC1IQM7_9FUNG|nr:hypothetical protein LPJ66_002376 [Kickxella alabastrina]